MGPEIIPMIIISPGGLLLVIGAIVGSALLYRRMCPETVARFHLKRIFVGYAAALLGLFAYSAYVAFERAQGRIFADPATAYSVWPGWTLFHFSLVVVVALPILTTIAISGLLFAYKHGWASLVTALIFAALIALTLDRWWGSHEFFLFSRPSLMMRLVSFLEMFVPFAIVAVAFSVAGRLPLLPPRFRE